MNTSANTSNTRLCSSSLLTSISPSLTIMVSGSRLRFCLNSLVMSAISTSLILASSSLKNRNLPSSNLIFTNPMLSMYFNNSKLFTLTYSVVFVFLIFKNGRVANSGGVLLTGLLFFFGCCGGGSVFCGDFLLNSLWLFHPARVAADMM